MTREQLIREIRKAAKKQGLPFELIKNMGKGSHYSVIVGRKSTTLKSGEMTPRYTKLVKKQLGLL